ncbi:hypothetical protein ILYODFUR_019763 [Ilyodon furcidens]|uniref:Uncharacterized protein n=1 Tax=Ilyodon furcidens TaxID=33524 RepID=A0ABV0V4I5_9TELE
MPRYFVLKQIHSHLYVKCRTLLCYCHEFTSNHYRARVVYAYQLCLLNNNIHQGSSTLVFESKVLASFRCILVPTHLNLMNVPLPGHSRAGCHEEASRPFDVHLLEVECI